MVRDYLIDDLLTSFFDRKQDLITIERSPERYLVRAVVPGYDDKEVNVSVRGNTLTLTGKHEMKNEFLHENASFERSYSIPSDVQMDGIGAEYKAGILVVTLPRRKNTAAELKSIPIKALGP